MGRIIQKIEETIRLSREHEKPKNKNQEKIEMGYRMGLTKALSIIKEDIKKREAEKPICERYKSGDMMDLNFGLEQIGEEFKITADEVRDILIRNNIRRRCPSEEEGKQLEILFYKKYPKSKISNKKKQ